MIRLTDRLIFLAFLVSVCSGTEVTPKFTLHQERSLDGIPSLSITFPNGHTDKLVLDKHSEDGHCHYIGHLEKEHEACVAMTGCIGQDELEFTILSQHATRSASMKWTKEGTVEYLDHPKAKESQFL